MPQVWGISCQSQPLGCLELCPYGLRWIWTNERAPSTRLAAGSTTPASRLVWPTCWSSPGRMWSGSRWRMGPGWLTGRLSDHFLRDRKFCLGETKLRRNSTSAQTYFMSGRRRKYLKVFQNEPKIAFTSAEFWNIFQNIFSKRSQSETSSLFSLLRCEASGGRPVPEVSWWNRTIKVRGRGRDIARLFITAL